MDAKTRRGNSFDTASLLIGLLRASGIPARYVYGTIQLPAEQAMNWVGGVTRPEAAQNLLGQGGIPNIGLISGGQIKFIKLEHVWVEAFVDYVPSRGAINKNPDTWVPMDASYKQYTYTQGMDIRTAVPLDAAALLSQAQTGATVNETEGWVQNLNGTNIQNALTSYQTQVKTYIDSTKPNATVGDVLGNKTIVQKNYSILMGTLPYKTLAVGSRMSSLPDSLRHKFQYKVYASDLDRSLDSPTITYTQPLPNLAGKKVTLSFVPARQADADLIASYLPKPHTDGSPIQPSEFPASLPGYLIRLTAELRVDGLLVASGGDFTMGQELTSSMGLFDPSSGWDFAEDNKPTAGEYIATHVDLQGVSQVQIQALKDRLGIAKNKLETNQYVGLTKEDISGDQLYGVILSYFVANQSASQIAQQAANMVEYRKPSFGSFMASAQTSYWYGLPRQVSFLGVVMDVDRYVNTVAAKDNDSKQFIAYVRQTGMRLSAYEHLIPEKLFTSAQHPVEGVSAVKAIAIATAQGQKIYTITQANMDTALPRLTISQAVKMEIQDAIAAGKQVTVSEGNVTVGGWSGAGYIIEDPATGSGAYKISGGANGAFLLFQSLMFVLWGVVLELILAGAAGTASILAIAAATAIAFNAILAHLLDLSKDVQIVIAAVEACIVALALAVAILFASPVVVSAMVMALIGSLGGLLWAIFNPFAAYRRIFTKELYFAALTPGTHAV